MQQVWLIDFDDTLAFGPVTWGLRHALPAFIAAHGLTVDPDALHESVLMAQEHTNRSDDLRAVIHAFFERMNWPPSLQQSLLEGALAGYEPHLFDDARPFLAALRTAGHTTIILSNNPNTPTHARALGLDALVDAVTGPHLLPGAGRKPDRSLWEHLIARFPALTTECAVVVGDDPWSDLAFATACALPGWLVDRDDRFGALPLADGSRRVRSLAEIPII